MTPKAWKKLLGSKEVGLRKEEVDKVVLATNLVEGMVKYKVRGFSRGDTLVTQW